MTIHENNSIKKPDGISLERTIIAVCGLITLISIAIRIYGLIVPRSLWGDEWALVENIITRTFSSLASTKLANEQSAPLLYLYTVKCIAGLSGYSETGLRLYSFIAFLGVLVLLYVLFKIHKIDAVFIALGITITATIGVYMRYSTEVKQYMGEVFFILAVLILYYLYDNHKIKLITLTLSCMVSLLFASSAAFFIASVYIVDFFSKLIRRDREIWKLAVSGCFMFAFFLIYYFWWLSPVAQSEYMINFWKDYKFVFYPISGQQIKRNLWLLGSELGSFLSGGRQIFGRPDTIAYIISTVGCILGGIGFFISIREKNKNTIVVGVAGFLLLAASHFGKAPIYNRLWLFFYVLAVLYLIICLVKMRDSRKLRFSKIIPLGLGVLFIVMNHNFINYIDDYISGTEYRPLIQYIENNIEEGEYVFPLSSSAYYLYYKTGNTNRIGNVNHDNIIYTDSPERVNDIITAGKGYILFSNPYQEPEIDELIHSSLQRLQEAGTLRQIMDVHETYLYYFFNVSSTVNRVKVQEQYHEE